LVVATLVVLLNSLTIANPKHFSPLAILKEESSFELSLTYGAVDANPTGSAIAKIYWNGEEIHTLNPTDSGLKKFSINVAVV
jgi:hypothetical protein